MKTLVLVTVPALMLLAVWGIDEEAVTSAPTNTAISVCAANPDPASPDFTQVDTPNTGDTVSSPVTVKGRINAFEGQFRITIFDAAGNRLADEAASAEGQVLSPFQKEISFSVTAETPACMWVYDVSARDGSPVHVVQIPLQLLPAATAGGLPPTGEKSPPDSSSWPAGVSLAGMLVLISGAATVTVAVKRR